MRKVIRFMGRVIWVTLIMVGVAFGLAFRLVRLPFKAARALWGRS